MTLEGNQLALRYYDDNFDVDTGVFDKTAGRLILEEHWEIDITTGKLNGKSIKDHTINGDIPAERQLSVFLGAEMSDAIGQPRTQF